MLWVNTDTQITQWQISSEVPSNLVEGMLWIETSPSTNINMNIAQENTLIVKPGFAKQYINNAWVAKEIKIYQNSQWSVCLANTLLYSYGDGKNAITGGWKATGTAVSDNTGLTLTGYYSTNNMLDLTDYSSLKFTVKQLSGTVPYIGISKVQSSFTNGTSQSIPTGSTSASISLANITGEYYIVIQGNSNSNKLIVYEIELKI